MAGREKARRQWPQGEAGSVSKDQVQSLPLTGKSSAGGAKPGLP